jgi:hypothetical protein
LVQQDPFPFMPPASTAQLLAEIFDEYVYTQTPSTMLYKYVDAMVGTTGVGSLLNQYMLARMSASMQTIYYNALDYIFSSVGGIARSPAESYPYNPSVDLLTADQWNEVRIKDAWYRARIVGFFRAAARGGSPDGIRMGINAAVATDCDIYEMWRWIDNFGISENLGRAPHPARNEVVVRVHKQSLLPAELRLCRDMLAKFVPVNTIVTVLTEGQSLLSPVSVSAAAADSSYYEVQRVVTATPALAQLPVPSQLPINLLPSECWLFNARYAPTIAPTAAFNVTSEYGYYYLAGGGANSPIDSVTYGTLNTDGSASVTANFRQFDTTGQFGPLTPWEIVDSPDNYPGGKFGQHPSFAPALNSDGTPYIFGYQSQQDYITVAAVSIIEMGGITSAEGYQLPVQPIAHASHIFYPDYAIAWFPPTKDSDVSCSLTRNSNTVTQAEFNNSRNFVR